jgi:hypothetical protein
VCLGAGGFALAAAILLPLFVYPRLAVFPNDPQAEQVLTGTGATMLMVDPKAAAGATVVHDADVTVTNFISQAPTGSSGDSAVWQIATKVDVAGKGMGNAQVEQVSVNKHTGVPTNCCGDRLVTDQEDTSGQLLRHSGYVAWPFNVQKHSYQIWDVNLRRTKTATYMGEEERDGIKTYKFRAIVPLQQVGTRDLPGGLFGNKAPNVTADAMYSDQQTYWIQPATGDVIRLDDSITQQYTYGGKTLTAFQADLKGKKLGEDRLGPDRQAAVFLPWVRSRATLVLIPIGLILLAVGAYLALGRRRRTSATPPPPPATA